MSTTSTELKSCTHDCFSCPYEDCLFDGVTDDERTSQDKEDMKLLNAKVTETSAVVRTGRPGRPRKIRDEEAVREAKRAQSRQYYWAHREERLEKQKNYAQEHKEELAQYNREYRIRNRKKVNEWEREKYYRNMKNPEFVEKERLRAHERYRKRKETLMNGLKGKE